MKIRPAALELFYVYRQTEGQSDFNRSSEGREGTKKRSDIVLLFSGIPTIHVMKYEFMNYISVLQRLMFI
jgi:hypothetical protein